MLVAAHPDDELLGSAGTLLFFKKKGYQIKIIFLMTEKVQEILVKKEKTLINKEKFKLQKHQNYVNLKNHHSQNSLIIVRYNSNA